MTRYAILANPVAGGTSIEEKLRMLRRPSKLLGCDVYGLATCSAAEFQDAARDLAGSGAIDVLVVAGGDASLDDAINAVGTSVTLGFLPFGSGNGFAYAAGLSEDPGDAAAQILAGSDHPVDLVRYNDARYGFFAGIGVEPEVIIDRSLRLAKEKPLLTLVDADRQFTSLIDPADSISKPAEGFLAYLCAALSVGLDGYQPIQATLHVDGIPHLHQNVLSMVIGTHPYYGYGLRANRHASLDSGLLHASTTYDAATKLLRIPKGLLCAAQGFLLDGNRICSAQAGREMILRTERPAALQMGGDYHETGTEFHFCVERGAIMRY
ncbi:hypothetical protein HYU19_03675 [Candidatus Woesearchaeota archaeon]|nr:hypothetical protein [Candidatus Woesearchaeota archaeon]